MKGQILKIADDLRNGAIDAETAQTLLLGLFSVSERYLLIEWVQGHPVIDGAKYADTKQDIMDYYDSLPKLLKSLVEYTICRIYNVH